MTVIKKKRNGVDCRQAALVRRRDLLRGMKRSDNQFSLFLERDSSINFVLIENFDRRCQNKRSTTYREVNKIECIDKNLDDKSFIFTRFFVINYSNRCI